MQPVTTILPTGDTESLMHLRKISRMTIFLQFEAAILYLFCSLMFPKSNFAAVGCGYLAIGISLTPVIYGIAKKRFLLVFTCISAFNLAPIWFLYLESVLPGYDAYVYSPAMYRMEAYLWVAVFQVCVNLLYLVIWKKITLFSIKSFSFLETIRLSPQFYINLTLFTCFFPLLAFYVYYGSGEILWKAMTGGRSGGGSAGGLIMQDYIGGTSSLMLPINSIWQLTPLFGVIAFSSTKEKSKLLPVICLAASIFVIFIFFLSGSRGSTMAVAAPVLFFLFYYNAHRGLKFWLVGAALLVFIIGLMEMQLRFRGGLLDVLANPDKAAKEQGLKSATTFDPTSSHRDNNMYIFCLVLKGYPKKYNYEGFHEFYTMLVNPIPRAIWPGKPMIYGVKDIDFQQKFILDGPLLLGTTSLSYGIPGEAYQSGGLFGILVYGIVYALFLVFFDGVVYYTRDKEALTLGLLGMSVFLSFWGYRAFFSLVTYIYPLLMFIALFRFVKMVKSK